jgi:putative endonuclease
VWVPRGRRPGSFRARYNINRLVYFEEFDDINQAIAREGETKQMARGTKSTLFESINPDRRDFERRVSRDSSRTAVTREEMTE